MSTEFRPPSFTPRPGPARRRAEPEAIGMVGPVRRVRLNVDPEGHERRADHDRQPRPGHQRRSHRRQERPPQRPLARARRATMRSTSGRSQGSSSASRREPKKHGDLGPSRLPALPMTRASRSEPPWARTAARMLGRQAPGSGASHGSIAGFARHAVRPCLPSPPTCSGRALGEPAQSARTSTVTMQSSRTSQPPAAIQHFSFHSSETVRNGAALKIDE